MKTAHAKAQRRKEARWRRPCFSLRPLGTSRLCVELVFGSGTSEYVILSEPKDLSG